MSEAKELPPEIEAEVQSVLEELYDVSIETPALQTAKKQLSPLLGQTPEAKTLKGLLSHWETVLSRKDFRKLLDYMNLEMITRHHGLFATLDRLGLTEGVSAETGQDNERLLILCGMGLSTMLSASQSGTIAHIKTVLQQQSKGLSIPDTLEFKLTPRLNQELGAIIKSNTPLHIELAATALLLAQLGVPENRLLMLVQNRDRTGLNELLYRFRERTCKPPTHTSFKLRK